MAELRLQAELRQSLELLLAPRLLQMLNILSLPYLEAVDELTKEAEENPVLEVERQDEYIEFLNYLTSDKKVRKEVDFQELPGLENVSRTDKTLEQHLLDQVDLADWEESQKTIAREIVGNIDDQGYLLAWPELRERLMAKHGLSRPTIDKILKLVQSLEPEGVGARDLAECLLIQIEAYSFENGELEELLKKVVKVHLPDLEAKAFDRLAAALNIPVSGVTEIANFIKHNLHPYPGSRFGGEARQVIPSFAVEKSGSGYRVVNLETRYGPTVRLSAQYLKMLDDPKTDEPTRLFLKERFKRAKELIEDFAKRSETLEKIARKIIDSQPDFLAKGRLWLRPLTQKSLADEFGLHPSTISRTVAEKYVQTPQGLFPLRLLCPRGPSGQTAARLKALIGELIDLEDKHNPHSDGKLAELLRDKGATIDRRTAAYYRQQLKLPSAAERKK
ncbi:MAG: RNA polymerase factor sigma-54 [Candidatus Margulisbacteria bacterium]|jgi:RNA polymerase sigma-54 factor|nr:RNA polymerase factor sigma-54 [Candidatus Margulisiibacteriota bacterium]